MEPVLKIGSRVELIDKSWHGTVAYVGSTQFQPGKWIGVILDEPKGKNNGVVQGKEYFKCNENHGLFVRAAQLKFLNKEGSSTSSMASSIDDKSSRLPNSKQMKLPLSKNNETSKLPAAGSKLRAPVKKADPSATGRSSTATTPASVESTASSLKSPSDAQGGSSNVSAVTSPQSGPEVPNVGLDQRRASAKTAPITETFDEVPQSPKTSVAQQVARIKQDMDRSMSLGIVKNSDVLLEGLSEGAQVEYLRSEVKDYSEKLETLRLKRQEDKQKLIDYEKCKIQLQQLVEYKTKMTELHSELQRQLQTAKKEAKEAIEAREAYQEEMSGLAESMEMATLDKEVAEERAEMLQSEVETLKEKVQELEIELELLHNEMSEKGGESGTVNSVQMKQLEQQNERLKEAVVKLRDLSAHERREYQRASKELEALKTQVAELSKKNDKLTVEVQQYEQQLTELKEQVDAALGSEEMVEQLTSQNLALEEKVLQLEESMEDFEQMRMMDEELQESTKEMEKELRLELDGANTRLNELRLQLKKSNEQVLDHEQTILKFRQLTNKYQAQIQDMKDKLLILDAEEKQQQQSEKNGNVPSHVLMQSQTKAWAEIVESELRKLELENALQHVRYLRSFLPDNFAKSGGDSDSVMLTLLFPRMSAKTHLLLNKLIDLYPQVPGGMRVEHVVKSHKAEQWSFVLKTSFYLQGLLCILHKFENVLNQCSIERLAKLAQLQPEMLAQERLLDFYFDLFRSNRLDENVSLENLEKLLNYFQNFYATHLSIENLECCQLANDSIKRINSGLAWIKHELCRAKFYVTDENPKKEVTSFFDDFSSFLVEAEKNLLRLKTVTPQDSKQKIMKFSDDVEALFKEANHCVEKSAKLLHQTCTAASARVSMIPDVDGVESKVFEELLQTTCEDLLLEKNMGRVSYDDFIKINLGQLISVVVKLIESIDKCSYENTADIKQAFPPILERAHARKKEAVEAEGLRWQLDKKSDEIKDLKMNLRIRTEEISEMKVRRDMAESKLQSTGKEGDERILRFQKQIEEAANDAKKKESEFDKVMDTYQKDLENLERENIDLKDQLQLLTKRSLLQGISAHGVYGSAVKTAQTFGPPASNAQNDSSLLEQQLNELRAAYFRSHAEKCALQGAKMAQIMKSLPPLKVPKKPSASLLSVDLDQLSLKRHDEINNLCRESAKLIKEYQNTAAVAKIIDFSKHRSNALLDKSKPAYVYALHLDNLRKLSDWIKSINVRLIKHRRQNLLAMSDYAGMDFSNRPNRTLLGRVSLGDGKNKPTRVVRVNVTPEEWASLQRKLLA